MTSELPVGALATASEVSIVALAMNGDDEAYGELVRRRQGSVRNLLRRLTRNSALADDLAQQTFIQGWQSIRSLRSPAAFAGWLRKLAVNFWLQSARGEKQEIALDDAVSAAAGIPLISAASEVSGVSAQLDLDAALAQLPHDVRLCIVLAYSEGMSHAEISQTAVMPLGTVKSHITRGSARLRELLHPYGDTHVR